MKATNVTIAIHEGAKVSVRDPHRYTPESDIWLGGGHIDDIDVLGHVPAIIATFREFADRLEAKLETAKAAETFHLPPDTADDKSLTPCEVEA